MRSLFFVILLSSSIVFAKSEPSVRHAPSTHTDPSLLSIKYEVNPCYQEKHNHGKMGSGKKDYRIIQDDLLFTPQVTKFFSGGGGEFAGGGASGYWIGPSPSADTHVVVQAAATK